MHEQHWTPYWQYIEEPKGYPETFGTHVQQKKWRSRRQRCKEAKNEVPVAPTVQTPPLCLASDRAAWIAVPPKAKVWRQRRGEKKGCEYAPEAENGPSSYAQQVLYLTDTPEAKNVPSSYGQQVLYMTEPPKKYWEDTPEAENGPISYGSYIPPWRTLSEAAVQLQR